LVPGSSTIWKLPNVVAAGVAGDRRQVRRVFACDYKALDGDAFKYHELWESGGAIADCRNNLGTRADYSWTQFDASGLLTTDLFIYCAANPITLYGGLSLLTTEMGPLLRFETDGWIVDPELTFQGGGLECVHICGCHDALFEGAVRGWQFYSAAIAIFENHQFGGDPNKANQNITISPWIDAAVVGLPFFSEDTGTDSNGNRTGHPMGGHEGISVTNGTVVTNLVVRGRASNGRPSRIYDCVHAGMAAVGLPGGKAINGINVGPGIHFDNTNTLYGRAFGIIGTQDLLRNVKVEGCLITNQPTLCELGGRDIQLIGCQFLAGKLDGGSITSNVFNNQDADRLHWRFGTGDRNTYDTSYAVSCGVFNGLDVNNITISNCVFNGYYSGGLNFGTTNAGQGFGGMVVVSGCTFIAPAGPNATTFRVLGENTQMPYAVEHNFADTQPESLIRYFNNTAVGYTMARRFVASIPFSAVIGLTSSDFLPLAQNLGWRFIDSFPYSVGNPYTTLD